MNKLSSLSLRDSNPNNVEAICDLRSLRLYKKMKPCNGNFSFRLILLFSAILILNPNFHSVMAAEEDASKIVVAADAEGSFTTYTDDAAKKDKGKVG